MGQTKQNHTGSPGSALLSLIPATAPWLGPLFGLASGRQRWVDPEISVGSSSRLPLLLPKRVRQWQAATFIRSSVFAPPLWPLAPLKGTRNSGLYSKPIPTITYRGRGPVPCLVGIPFSVYMAHAQCMLGTHAHTRTHTTHAHAHMHTVRSSMGCGFTQGISLLALWEWGRASVSSLAHICSQS